MRLRIRPGRIAAARLDARAGGRGPQAVFKAARRSPVAFKVQVSFVDGEPSCPDAGYDSSAFKQAGTAQGVKIEGENIKRNPHNAFARTWALCDYTATARRI
jgi:hypothetical protein